MKVGDLVRVKYDGSVGIIASVEQANGFKPWVRLHTGEEFRSDKLEVISDSR